MQAGGIFQLLNRHGFTEAFAAMICFSSNCCMASDASNIKLTECEEVCSGPLEILKGHVPVMARRACFSDGESTEHVTDVEAIDTASSQENLTCTDDAWHLDGL
eukprot:Skav214797  [mRNA]  locus=scaffold740:34556:38356:- [translate_table: standard]